MSYLSLHESFQKFGALLPPMREQEIALYDSHFQLLQQWNERINLVSRKSISEAFAFHYADCIHMVHATEEFSRLPVLDIGTGAGFPGLVFAIRFPEQEITLFEKSLKKQTFLSAVVTTLSLKNVRLEGAIPQKLSSGLVFARAVFPRSDVFYKLKPLLAKNSLFVATSGGMEREEKIPKWFSKIKEVKYCLPADAGNRRIEIFAKI